MVLGAPELCALGGAKLPFSSDHTCSQGLPGPPGEKGETGDVGQMVSVTGTWPRHRFLFQQSLHFSMLNGSPSPRAPRVPLAPEDLLEHQVLMGHKVPPVE